MSEDLAHIATRDAAKVNLGDANEQSALSRLNETHLSAFLRTICFVGDTSGAEQRTFRAPLDKSEKLAGDIFA